MKDVEITPISKERAKEILCAHFVLIGVIPTGLPLLMYRRGGWWDVRGNTEEDLEEIAWKL